jgi:hypothetical protein
MMGSKKIQMGFHFFHDLDHYTIGQADQWHRLTGEYSGGFVVLRSPTDRAIPETILDFFFNRNIMPVIQFDYHALRRTDSHDVDLLLTHYHRAGVKLLQLEGYVNQKEYWQNTSSTNSILVQIAEAVVWFHQLAVVKGFTHVLPKMVPGGDYWDLIVLEQLLKAIEQTELGLTSLVLSFAAWTYGHSLLWGEGGQAKWIQARPYQKAISGEDHRGFLGFAWYQEIAVKVLGYKLPVILFDAGRKNVDVVADSAAEFVVQLRKICDFLADPRKQNLLDHVTGVCFYFAPEFASDELITTLQRYIPRYERKTNDQRNEQSHEKAVGYEAEIENQKQIEHYLLLPKYEWGIAKWHLEASVPFILKYHATLGFRLDEAYHAEKVTVVMDNDVFPEGILAELHEHGCDVRVLRGDGTKIAALLAE